MAQAGARRFPRLDAVVFVAPPMRTPPATMAPDALDRCIIPNGVDAAYPAPRRAGRPGARHRNLWTADSVIRARWFAEKVFPHAAAVPGHAASGGRDPAPEVAAATVASRSTRTFPI